MTKKQQPLAIENEALKLELASLRAENEAFRKRVENLPDNKEQEFRTLADNFPYSVVRYDTEFRRVYVNRAYFGFVNVSADEIIGKKIDDFWMADKHLSLEHFKSHLQKVVDTKVNHDFFIKWQDSNGDLNFREMLLVPEFDAAGEVSHVVAIGHNTNMYEKATQELRELNLKLQMLSAKRETAREEERKHIAREVHDELGQLLSVLHLNASTIDYLHGKRNPDISTKAKSMMMVADQALYVLRNLVSRLRPANVEHGFSYAIKALVDTFSTNTGIACQLDMPDAEISMDESHTVALMRILQETLTNVIRHSGADLVTIDVLLAKKHMTITVHDNGCGFNKNLLYKPDAFGLVGMQERILVLNGTLEIISEPNHANTGTTIKLCMPISG